MFVIHLFLMLLVIATYYAPLIIFFNMQKRCEELKSFSGLFSSIILHAISTK